MTNYKCSLKVNVCMKILVASPIYDKMEYCFSYFLESINSISYPHDILLVENSKDDKFYEKIKDQVNVIKDNSEGTNLQKVVHSRNLILDYALKNNYDYVLMLDSDVLVPKDIIEKLLNHKKDIVSGLYYNYFNEKLLPVAWTLFTEQEFQELKNKYHISQPRLEIRRHLTQEEASSNKLIEVLYPSAGCMLISRKVFDEARKSEGTDEDIVVVYRN